MLVFTNLCRLCTDYRDVTYNLNNFDSENIVLLNKLKILEPDDELPNGVCSACIARFNEAYKFIDNCVKSQVILKQYLEHLRNGKVLEEIIGIKIKDSEINLVNNNANEEIGYENEIVTGNVENYDKSKSLKPFEFVNVKIEKNEVKIEESNISIDEREQISCYDEKHLNNCNFTQTPYVSNVGPVNYRDKTNPTNSQNDTRVKIEDFTLNQTGEDIETQTNVATTLENSSSNSTTNIFNTISGGTGNECVSLKRDFVCKICGETFEDRIHLRLHNESHKNEGYKCGICGKEFSRKFDLVTHIRIHTNEKSHVCHLCGSAFKSGSNLRRHIRIHTDDKIYKCEMCEKGFTDNSNLMRHVRAHAGLKLFKCEVCDKRFTTHGYIKIHMLMHEDD